MELKDLNEQLLHLASDTPGARLVANTYTNEWLLHVAGDTALTSSARLVAHAYALKLATDPGALTPEYGIRVSVETLDRICNCHAATAGRARQSLVKRGWLTRIGKRGYGTPLGYALTIPEGAAPITL